MRLCPAQGSREWANVAARCPIMSDAPLHVAFVGGPSGQWRVNSIETISGEGLPDATALSVLEGQAPASGDVAAWILRGVVSNARYVTSSEQQALRSTQAGLGRRSATSGVLIPIRKSPAWWELPQDERRAIFEERSHHVAIGMTGLPAVARRLHHSRDLGEPFDFLTWFEFAPEDASVFDSVLDQLRTSEEWRFVDREVEIRVTFTGK